MEEAMPYDFGFFMHHDWHCPQSRRKAGTAREEGLPSRGEGAMRCVLVCPQCFAGSGNVSKKKYLRQKTRFHIVVEGDGSGLYATGTGVRVGYGKRPCSDIGGRIYVMCSLHIRTRSNSPYRSWHYTAKAWFSSTYMSLVMIFHCIRDWSCLYT